MSEEPKDPRLSNPAFRMQLEKLDEKRQKREYDEKRRQEREKASKPPERSE